MGEEGELGTQVNRAGGLSHLPEENTPTPLPTDPLRHVHSLANTPPTQALPHTDQWPVPVTNGLPSPTPLPPTDQWLAVHAAAPA